MLSGASFGKNDQLADGKKKGMRKNVLQILNSVVLFNLYMERIFVENHEN